MVLIISKKYLESLMMMSNLKLTRLEMIQKKEEKEEVEEEDEVEEVEEEDHKIEKKVVKNQQKLNRNDFN